MQHVTLMIKRTLPLSFELFEAYLRKNGWIKGEKLWHKNGCEPLWVNDLTKNMEQLGRSENRSPEEIYREMIEKTALIPKFNFILEDDVCGD